MEDDLNFESLRSLPSEIRDISVPRQDSESMSSELCTISVHIKQLSVTQGLLESQFSHDPPQEDSDDDRSFAKVHHMPFTHDNTLCAVKEIRVNIVQ